MTDDDGSDSNGRRRGRPRRLMTDDERALVGAEHRREQRRSRPAGVPITYAQPVQFDVEEDDEPTAPERILSREVTQVELEILHRLGISAEATVTMGDFAKFLTRNNRREKDHKSGSEQLGKQMEQLRELLAKPPNQAVADLQDQVSELVADRKKALSAMRWLRGVAITAIVAAFGSVGTFAVRIWDRAKDEGEAIIRLDHVERDVYQLRQDLREDRARNQPKE